MQKKTFYLWRSDYATQEEYENAKKTYTKMGFRVVTFIQKQSGQDIQETIRALIQNHTSDNESVSGKDVIP